MPEIEGYSIFRNGVIETFKAGLDNYEKNMAGRTHKQLTLLDKKNTYEIKKVRITYQEID